MIANFFNKTKPLIVFSIVILLFIYSLISTVLQVSDEFSILFLVENLGFFLLYILFLLLFKFIVEKNKLTRDNSYGLLLVVLILGTFSEAIFSNYIVFSNIVLLLSYRKIYSLRSEINTKMKLFDAGFWVGVATLLYSWSIFYMLFIYVGILIYKKGGLKNVLTPVIGLATPVFIYFTYQLYYDRLEVFYNRFNYDVNLNFSAYNSLRYLIPIAFLTIVLLWAIVKVTPKVVLISNRLKFSWNVVLNHLLISALIIVVSPIKNGSEMIYLIFPSAIIIANFLQRSESSIFKNLILYLFLIISVSVYFL